MANILIKTPATANDGSEVRTYPDHTYGTGDPITRREIDACRNAMDDLGDVSDFCYSRDKLAAFIGDDIVELATCRDEATATALAKMLNNYQAFLQRTRVPLGDGTDNPNGTESK